MPPAFVLVHSPSVGPLTWAPVADRLRTRGETCLVPSLLSVADADPPFWPRLVATVAATARELDPDQPVILVLHSNAGLFAPLLVAHAGRPIAACLFVDAALPGVGPSTPLAPPEFLEFLRGLVDGDRLPPWTSWWDEDDIAPMLPDAEVRAAVEAEQPRLPLAYYEQQVPVPPGWDDRPCAYLIFSPGYADEAEQARRQGWVVEEIPGEHLHQVVDPDAVTDRLLAITAALRAPG